MNKIVVGILPNSEECTYESYYDDYNKFIALYPKRIYECGAIPFGILMNDGNVDYVALEMCDAFLIPGGKRVNRYVYETIYYALKHNKPLLGICLGSQAIAIFSAINERLDKDKEYATDEVISIYQSLKSEYDGTLLSKLPDGNMHNLVDITRDNVRNHIHDIEIDENSILYSIVNSKKLSVVSLHNYDYKYVGKGFKVTAYSSDGVKEAIEYDNKDYFIVGVHFHPEIMEDNRFFERLIEEARKRK